MSEGSSRSEATSVEVPFHSLSRAQPDQSTLADSQATTPVGPQGSVRDSQDSEVDQLVESDADSAQGTATSLGGAVAGPGPSSSLKRSFESTSAVTRDEQPPPLVKPHRAPWLLGANKKKKKRGRPPKPVSAVPAASTNNDGTLYMPIPLPHYSVERVEQNSRKHRHVLKFHDDVTDATQNKWPLEREFDPNNKENGKTYWYERPDPTEGRHRSTLEKIGDELAKKLGLHNKNGTEEYWVLHRLPKDYLFTVHHCVTSSAQSRTDVYMFGSAATPKFRSTNEIIPHLYWLLEHGPLDRLKCQCKYCTKKSQSDVNRIEGLEQRQSSSSVPPYSGPTAPTSSAAKVSNKKLQKDDVGDDRDAGVDGSDGASGPTDSSDNKAPIRSRTFNSDSPEPSYSGAFVDKQRDVDLAYPGKAPRFRRGELVWAEIPQGSLEWSSEAIKEQRGSISLRYWPAIVQHRDERTESELQQPYIAGHETIPEFVHVKKWVYSIVYLGTANTAQGLEQTQIKPWLLKDLSEDDNGERESLWNKDTMLNRDSYSTVWDGTRMRKVDLAVIETLDQAVVPSAFAMQIAAHVMSSFSVIDRFLIKDHHFVTDRPSLTPEDVESMKRYKDNWFYQSMYLGSELVWVNDVVRLIHHKDQPLPPLHRPQEDALERSLFMHVQAIWKDQETKLVKYSGQVYELRDDSMPLVEDEDNKGAEGLAAIDPRQLDLATTAGKSPGSAAFYPVQLPPAPSGYTFHRLTPGQSQVTVDLEYVAGRYYPLPVDFDHEDKIREILQSFPNIDPEDADSGEPTKSVDQDELKLTEAQRLVTLAGLTPAVRLYNKVSKWQGDRMTALINAETNSCQEVASFFERELDHC
ncbi:uncharacterized protein JCM15063_003988 [Sporobolomyces koalae]|uniref:uncharacterized protein n=1 Tax=Sporobolomyces koalae TaxID=500713 RepID=UPI003179FBC2